MGQNNELANPTPQPSEQNTPLPTSPTESQTPNTNSSEPQPSKQKSPFFAIFALISTILLFAWTLWWSIGIFNSNSCEGTSCGEVIAWTLIFGVVGDVILLPFPATFALLSIGDIIQNKRKVNLPFLIITAILFIASITLAVATIAMVLSYSH